MYMKEILGGHEVVKFNDYTVKIQQIRKEN